MTCTLWSPHLPKLFQQAQLYNILVVDQTGTHPSPDIPKKKVKKEQTRLITLDRWEREKIYSDLQHFIQDREILFRNLVSIWNYPQWRRGFTLLEKLLEMTLCTNAHRKEPYAWRKPWHATMLRYDAEMCLKSASIHCAPKPNKALALECEIRADTAQRPYSVGKIGHDR
jgi:hypothetical protein